MTDTAHVALAVGVNCVNKGSHVGTGLDTTPRASSTRGNRPDEEVHREVPREAAQRRVLLTVSPDGVVDLRNVRRDVRHARVVEPVDPYSGVPLSDVSV